MSSDNTCSPTADSMLYTSFEGLVHPQSGENQGAKTAKRTSYDDAADDGLHTLQLFLQYPRVLLDPTIYRGFFLHSPAFAHTTQFKSSSTQSSSSGSFSGLSKFLTWIHLVADHFSPSMTGQLPCKLVESVDASG